MRLYANENFPLPVVLELRKLGHDVLTSQDCGNAGKAIPGLEVLRFGTKEQRAVVTINRKHFIKLHRDSQSHAGIIVCTFDVEFKAQAKRIDDAMKSFESLEGQLLRVNRPSI